MLPRLALFGDRLLQLLGVRQMRDDGWPHFDEKRFQFGIRSVGNQRLVEAFTQPGLI
jgi:hypothetical protein